VDAPGFLERIQYRGSREPTAAVLRDLHLAHLYAVPFENLDIHLGRPISLDLEKIYQKIVVRRRGGFCYELNGLFGWLLRELGFQVTLLSARDLHEDGRMSPEYDHLVLLVETPLREATSPPLRWLADAGWGDTFRLPLRLDERGVQPEGQRVYRIEPVGERLLLWQQPENGIWERNYSFTLQPREYQEFAGMCFYHQTSAESIFTRQRLCTQARPDGRVTLDDYRFDRDAQWSGVERPLTHPGEFEQLLSQVFGIKL